MQLDNSVKEDMAVGTIKRRLQETGIVKAEINENDKGLSWDGNLIVHSGVPFSKNNYVDSIPVQVKYRSRLNRNGKYSVNTQDLRNYSSKNRIIYFIITQFKGQQRVFYKAMTLYDLKKYVHDAGEHNSISILFDELPEDSAMVKNIIEDFIIDVRRQKQLIPNVLNIKDLLRMKPRGTLRFQLNVNEIKSVKDFFKVIRNTNPYLYYHESELDIDYPIDRIGELNLTVERNMNLTISTVEGEVLFDNCKSFYNEHEVCYKIGPCISVCCTSDSTKINFRMCGSLEDRVKCLKFIDSLYSNGSIYIDKTKVGIISGYNKQDADIAKFLLGFYLDLIELSNKLSLKSGINLDQLSKQEQDMLFYFTQSVLHDCEIETTEHLAQCFELNLGDSSILCCSMPAGKNRCRILSVFHENMDVYAYDDKEEIEVSKYYLLLVDEINALSVFKNTDFNVMLDDVKIHLTNSYAESQGILLLLKLISFYDQEHDMLALQACDELANMLYSFNPSNDVHFINSCQVHYRLKGLSINETERLCDIIKVSNDNSIKCASCLLLKAKAEFEMYYNLLNIQEKETFDNYPISNLRQD